jgi:UDP-glucose 4-epimerase
VRFFITGCAGFIGSSLTDRLISNGYDVVGVDNLSTGQLPFIKTALKSKKFNFYKGDLLDIDFLNKAIKNCDFVFHLAANADVRFGTDNPRRDLEQNTIGTFNVLEAMRLNKVTKIAFSSTGSVYGDSKIIPTPEDAPFPIQTSLYAASKLASEGLVAAYCEGFDFKSWVFRFVSILGERYTHGHVFDFYKKLNNDPRLLCILGNGEQRKSYLYIQDCIDAMIIAIEKSDDRVNIFNLGVDGYCQVNDSVAWICKELGLSPQLKYSGGIKGWIGDNPFIHLDTKKIQSLGWEPKINIEQGVIKTINFLKANEWVFESRS